jgi:hypothetical protein
MSELDQLWVATLTTTLFAAGTNSPIAVIANQDGDDKIHHTVEDTPQSDLESGGANIYPVPVAGSGLEETTNPLDGTYFRIALRGSDAWLPLHVLIWGKVNGRVVPLASRFLMKDWISSNQVEGNISFPVHRVALGNAATQIDQLVLLIETSDSVAEAGTDDRIWLRITTTAGLEAVNFVSGDTPSAPDLEPAEANFYTFPAANVFARNQLDATSIVLGIEGDDQWSPARLFLFGLDTGMTSVDVESIVPLVHVEDWAISPLPLILSTDPHEGEESVTLPLL